MKRSRGSTSSQGNKISNYFTNKTEESGSKMSDEEQCSDNDPDHHNNNTNDDDDQRHEYEDSFIEDDEEEEEEVVQKKKAKKEKGKSSTSSGNVKKSNNNMKKSRYTPLELQFMKIKEKYPDTVLCVECGYKHTFFGTDADIASSVLNIYKHQSHNFMVASIPTVRLNFHMSRLVQAGYKVGLVSQTETAALKKAGNQSSKLFSRDLTAMYTTGTMINEEMDSNMQNSNYLLCLCEKTKKGGNTVEFGLVAAQLSTGEILYDNFTDDFSRSELETRVIQIQPSELVISQSLSDHTKRVLRVLLAQYSGANNLHKIRTEQLKPELFEYETALSNLRKIFVDEDDTNLSRFQELPEIVQVCLGILAYYLKDFKLDKILKLSNNIKSFSSNRRMKMSGTTVSNLEILANSTNGGVKGSLFWVLNQTKTPFGMRLLKRWVSQPLTDIKEINFRLDAVQELMNPPECLHDLLDSMPTLPDLERALCKIHYKRSRPAEFLNTLQAFQRIFNSFPNEQAIDKEIKSVLISRLLKSIPMLTTELEYFLTSISRSAAEQGKMNGLFTSLDQFPALAACHKTIQKLDEELQSYLKEMKKKSKISNLTYVAVKDTEYLLEVKNADVKLVPNDWKKVSNTKQVSRFHTTTIVEKVALIAQEREKLEMESEKAWGEFLSDFPYERFSQVVQQLAVLDSLCSLAECSKRPGYCKPQLNDKGGLCITEGRNPIVELLRSDDYVPNDTQLNQNQRAMIITGPNAGGKSSYLRQVALLSVMAQIGSFVPATEFEMTPFDAIFTRMGAFDNILSGESTFFVELSQTSHILRDVTDHSLVILDELGRGTSEIDGEAIANAVLKHLLSTKCLILFVTHYNALTSIAQLYPGVVANYHMSYMEQSEGTSDSIVFLFKLKAEPATRSFGFNCAKLAGIPIEVVEEGAYKASMMEDLEAMNSEKLQQFRDTYMNLVDIQR